jgi:pyruvate dehydrogenase E1 component alpha subunit
MPREKISIPDSNLESLSILDEKGQVDKGLEPEMDDAVQLKLFRAMLLGRRFDERMLSLQRQGRIGTFAPISGQEASQLGAVAVLEPLDWMAPSFRETAAQLWRGVSMEEVILTYGGYSLEGDNGEEHNNLPISVPVGSQVLHAVGLAWAIQYHKRNEVAMAFLGDGGTSEGDFHEGMNFAAVYQAPVIFVCQNNQWAISVPRKKQTLSKTIAQKAIAYGMPGIQVDGNDILAVYSAAKEAVERARSGGGPTLIECVTYRMMMHTTADDPKKYRSEEEVESWREKDPITRFQGYLMEKGILSEEKIEGLESEIKNEIQEGVDRAEVKMKDLQDPIRMFNHAYETTPNHIEEQRRGFEEERAEAQEDARHG